MLITHTTWAKGQSGNPGGRPRILEAVSDIARESTTPAIETLRTIAADQAAPHAARVSAATALLDKSMGQARAAVVGRHKRRTDGHDKSGLAKRAYRGRFHRA